MQEPNHIDLHPPIGISVTVTLQHSDNSITIIYRAHDFKPTKDRVSIEKQAKACFDSIDFEQLLYSTITPITAESLIKNYTNCINLLRKATNDK